MNLFNSFIRYISSPLIFQRDGLNYFYRYLSDFEKIQYWSRDRLLEYQFNKLKQLLTHAYENCEYYKKRFDEAGFDPIAFKNFNEIEKIPTLSKKEIRDNLNTLIAKNFQKQDLHSAETGGTTGVKMRFYRNNSCLSPKEASLYRFEKWTGWNFGERAGIIWPAQQDYVGHWTLKSKIKNELSLRQLVFPAALLDDNLIETYVNQLINKRPTMIRAFPTPVFEVAKFINNRDIHDIRLKGVITTGEPLYQHQRNSISKAFGCEVFDAYRTREVGPIAQECECHYGMHINADSLYVETIPFDKSSKPMKGCSEIVVTDLWNYGMPLIRYKMGDVGVLSGDQCQCGRGLPLLKNVSGRTADIFYTPNKKRIPAITLVLYLVDEAPGLLGQVQIIQDKLDHLIIKMTNDPPPSDEIMEYQVKTVRQLFGPEMRVSFQEVSEIPFEKSGKYRFTICKIGESDL